MIRPYTREDYESVRALSAVLDELHRERAPWMFQRPDQEPRPAEQLERQIATSDGALLVADEGGEVVGYVLIAMRDAPELPIYLRQRWGVIDGLVVAPARRRRGIATELVRAAEAWIKNAGVSWLELSVHAVNGEARAFYEAAGYSPMIYRMRKAL
jgi:ribosomal protein S18 acetylase RimI-like enzyme